MGNEGEDGYRDLEGLGEVRDTPGLVLDPAAFAANLLHASKGRPAKATVRHI